MANSVLPEEDQDKPEEKRARSPSKKRRLARPSPTTSTLADHVEAAMAKQDDYDLSFQPDVEAGIVQHPDDFAALDEAIAKGHVATRKKLTVNVNVTEDDQSSTGTSDAGLVAAEE